MLGRKPGGKETTTMLTLIERLGPIAADRATDTLTLPMSVVCWAGSRR